MKNIIMKNIIIFLILLININISYTDWYKPKIWDNILIQLQWEINKNLKTNIYDIDLFDTDINTINEIHKEWKRVICYFSAWTYEDWREDKNKFNKEIIWKKLENWEWEKWLDISKYWKFDEVMISRLNLAVFKKCDWVDFDNISYSPNSYNEKWFNISYDDYIKYNTFLAKQAHKRWLSVWLKNNLLQINDLVKIFDFEINEECYTYNECDYLKPFIINNKPVFWIEYEIEKNIFCPKAIKDWYSFVLDNYNLDWTKTSFCNETKNIKKNNIQLFQIWLNKKTKEKVDKILNNLQKKHSKKYINKLYNKLINKLEELKIDNDRYINDLQYSLLIDYIINKIRKNN